MPSLPRRLTSTVAPTPARDCETRRVGFRPIAVSHRWVGEGSFCSHYSAVPVIPNERNASA